MILVSSERIGAYPLCTMLDYNNGNPSAIWVSAPLPVGYILEMQDVHGTHGVVRFRIKTSLKSDWYANLGETMEAI